VEPSLFTSIHFEEAFVTTPVTGIQPFPLLPIMKWVRVIGPEIGRR
jgi:hypothetical protein